ncbi:MAG: hypothetical protein M3496_06945 [Pseudomonadota bacterium]|nr:hypothetical protein [Burkholderiaceae bacterium]MDQ3445901.1 hypothetical protein [Pseudomonadota bacterium]
MPTISPVYLPSRDGTTRALLFAAVPDAGAGVLDADAGVVDVDCGASALPRPAVES